MPVAGSYRLLRNRLRQYRPYLLVLLICVQQHSLHHAYAPSSTQQAGAVQVIRSANAEVCRKLQSPLYEYYLKLPGAPTAGQASIKQFHSIMSDLLAEV